MKLQVAIDRISFDKANELAHQLDGIADIIELGTSIVKDYGLLKIKNNFSPLKKSKLLIDLKTNDEGKYEFQKGYEAGADILTVMAESSISTIQQTYNEADQSNRSIMIDLMETNVEKIKQLTKFDQAIFGLHHSKDDQSNYQATDSVKAFHNEFPQIKKISVAGGIDLAQAEALGKQDIAGVIIIGSKIMNNDDPIRAAKKFKETINNYDN